MNKRIILYTLGIISFIALLSSVFYLKNKRLGYSVVTGYSTTLSASMSATQDYIPISSMKLPDGTSISISDLGTKAFFDIEPGTSNEEIIKCTSSTATRWTSCTRGLAFSGTSEASVSANKKTHSAGSKIVMSNVHYVNEQFVEQNENDLSFGDGVSTTYKTITFNAGNPSGYDPGFRWNTSTNQLEFRRYDESSYRVMETNFRGTYANYASLPTTSNSEGDTAITTDDSKMYTWDVASSAWVLIGGSSGAGTIYKSEFLGTEATGGDNKTFTLTSGSFPSEKFLQVYRNGVFMRYGASYDYTTPSTNSIKFNYAVNDTDTIAMYVVSIDLYNANWSQVTEDLLPDTDNTHDIGSYTLQFKDFYIGGSIYLGGIQATSTPTANALVKGNASGKIDDGWINSNQLNTQTMTAGETISGATLPVPVFVSSTDGRIYANDANDTSRLKFIGFAISNSTAGNSITIQTNGVVSGFSGLTTSSYYYVQDIVGTIGTSQGTYVLPIGIAISSTKLKIKEKISFSSLETSYVKDTSYTSQTDAFVTIIFTGNSGSGESTHGASITVDGVVVAQELGLTGLYNGFKSSLTAFIPQGKTWSFTWGDNISSASVNYRQFN